jgi:hypothetical protein
MAAIIKLPRNTPILPDNKLWTNRFEIKSETTDRIYIVSQNIEKRHWACSCPAWKTRRYCKHLESIGLPSFEKPYEAILQ